MFAIGAASELFYIRRNMILSTIANIRLPVEERLMIIIISHSYGSNVSQYLISTGTKKVTLVAIPELGS